MLALRAVAADPADPLSGLAPSAVAEPTVPEGWEVVEVRAAAVNHHDLSTLRGVAVPPERLPVTLGSDAAGLTADGREVLCHAVVPNPGVGVADETEVFGRLSILSEVYDGTHAERVAVPSDNLLDKPASLSFVEAACLPTAWLTAYRMLFTKARVRPGDRVLVQGAGGGVATAAIALATAAGCRTYATSRAEHKRAAARELGASAALPPGERLPTPVDAAIDTVGEATFGHSLRALVPGGTLVVAGATTGPHPPAELHRVFAKQLRILGSSMGTRGELAALLRLLETTGLRPRVAATHPLAEGVRAYRELLDGELVGKVVLLP